MAKNLKEAIKNKCEMMEDKEEKKEMKGEKKGKGKLIALIEAKLSKKS